MKAESSTLAAAALAYMSLSGIAPRFPQEEEPEWSDDELPIAPRRSKCLNQRRHHDDSLIEDGEGAPNRGKAAEQHSGHDRQEEAEWISDPHESMGYLEKTAQWLGIPQGGRMPKLLMASEEQLSERAPMDEGQLRIEGKRAVESSPHGSSGRSQAPIAGGSSVGLLDFEGDENYGDEDDDMNDIFGNDFEKEAMKSQDGGSELGAEPSMKLLMPPPEPPEPPTAPMLAPPFLPDIPSAPEPEISSSSAMEDVDPGENAEIGVDIYHPGAYTREVGRMGADRYFGLEGADSQQEEYPESGDSFNE